MKFEWEMLSSENYFMGYMMSTHRAKVLGGWLVLNRNYCNGKETSISESMIFIPDPEYKWVITEY